MNHLSSFLEDVTRLIRHVLVVNHTMVIVSSWLNGVNNL